MLARSQQLTGRQLSGQGPRQAKIRQEAGLEADDLCDPFARDSDDEYPEGAEAIAPGVQRVRAEGRLPIGAGVDETARARPLVGCNSEEAAGGLEAALTVLDETAPLAGVR